MCLCVQEVFETRYLKVPQQPEGGPVPCQRIIQGRGDRVGSLSTSASSESESSTESESSSEEVTTQLADLEEQVGISRVSNGANSFRGVVHLSAFDLIVSLMADFSVEERQ